jgi:hypothetical protein
LRRALPGLWRGERRTLIADDASGLYGYSCADGVNEALVVLNNGRVPQSVALPGAPSYRLALATDATAALDEHGLMLPAFGGAVVLRDGAR